MALLPRMLRPSVLIRRKAMYSGVLGNSNLWKAVAIVVFGKSTIKKFFGRNEEIIEVTGLGSGRFMEIVTEKPPSRRQRRKQRKAGHIAPTLKERRRAAEREAAALDSLRR